MTMWSMLLTDDAEAEFRALPEDMKGRFFYIGTLMTERGPNGVGMPHVRPVESKLWEMRLTGKDGIARAFYFMATGQRIVVLRIFIKKTEKAPRREIEIALWRMENFGD